MVNKTVFSKILTVSGDSLCLVSRIGFVVIVLNIESMSSVIGILGYILTTCIEKRIACFGILLILYKVSSSCGPFLK